MDKLSKFIDVNKLGGKKDMQAANMASWNTSKNLIKSMASENRPQAENMFAEILGDVTYLEDPS